MDVSVTIIGIPAIVKVNSAIYSEPDPGADSDWDHHGGWNIEFTVCDRNGRPAPWLETKMNKKDRLQLYLDIIEQIDPVSV